MSERDDAKRRVVLVGMAVGAAVSAVLSVIRMGLGSGVGPDMELDYMNFVLIAFAPPTTFLSMTLDSNSTDPVVGALIASLAFSGLLYGLLALGLAAAWRFKRSVGVLVLVTFSAWSVFWLLAGVGCAEVVR